MAKVLWEPGDIFIISRKESFTSYGLFLREGSVLLIDEHCEGVPRSVATADSVPSEARIPYPDHAIPQEVTLAISAAKAVFAGLQDK